MLESCMSQGSQRAWQALAEVHRANVAHLDLRPEHVFVARDAGSGVFTASLLDFSAARELGPAGALLSPLLGALHQALA